MHRFFVEPYDIQGEIITVKGTDVNHIRNVLRMKHGEQAEIHDGTGKRYQCVLKEAEEKQVLFRIREYEQDDRELSSKIYLFQGLPKGDKMEFIIQKAVELGVYEVVPVGMHRCVVKLDEKRAGKKLVRWNSIAEAAAKQSGRSRVPAVHSVLSFQEALEYADLLDVILVLYEKEENMRETKQIMKKILPGQSVGIFVGPEGGFEEWEAEQAVRGRARTVSLGRRILRTETAGLAALAILMYHLE